MAYIKNQLITYHNKSNHHTTNTINLKYYLISKKNFKNKVKKIKNQNGPHMRTMRRIGYLDYGTKDQIVIMKNTSGYSRNFI